VKATTRSYYDEVVRSGAAAAFVLGQPDLTAGANSTSPSQRSLDDPRQVALIALTVADAEHRRILRPRGERDRDRRKRGIAIAKKAGT
jgi:hypothetical protein